MFWYQKLQMHQSNSSTNQKLKKNLPCNIYISFHKTKLICQQLVVRETIFKTPWCRYIYVYIIYLYINISKIKKFSCHVVTKLFNFLIIPILKYYFSTSIYTQRSMQWNVLLQPDVHEIYNLLTLLSKCNGEFLMCVNFLFFRFLKNLNEEIYIYTKRNLL